MPSVCEKVTDSPSPAAWSGVPRVPTRYAAISVLPWPGVSAWPAPSAAAVRIEMSRTSGDRSAVRKIEGRSPLVTPPGTPAAVAGTAVGRRPGPCRPRQSRRRWRGGRRHLARPGSGDASAMSNAGSVGPPGVATIATDVSAERLGQQVRRIGGQPGRRVLGSERAVAAGQRHRRARDHDLAPAEPLAEGRVGVVDRVPAAIGPVSTRKPHTMRIVDRPPTPGGNVRPASVSVSSTRRRRPSAPATARDRRRRSPGRHRSPRRRPRRRHRCRSRDAPGRSGSPPGRCTTSSRIRSGSTRIPV